MRLTLGLNKIKKLFAVNGSWVQWRKDDHFNALCRSAYSAFLIFIPQPPLFSALFAIKYRWQQLSINKCVEGTESCRQPKFHKITHLLCFRDFCFSFLYLLPRKSVGPLSSETSEPVFWAFQGPLLLKLFCWIWFLLQINKSTVYLLLKENYRFGFLIVLQSQVTCATLNSLGRQLDACQSTPVCYYSKWWSVCLFEWVYVWV